MLSEASLFTFVAGLFAIMNPIGNFAVFGSLTQGSSKEDVRYSAWTCAIACIVTLLIVGPGTMLVAAQARTWTGKIEISVVILLMSLAVGLIFSMAKPSPTGWALSAWPSSRGSWS